ncbi:MAG: hypothetical protein IT380_17805 [Myxococcales bacterium]|nr:hypothetical protein [Myxococcales bacterium]
MFDDTRLDGKLQELSRELVARPMVPGFNVADAFTMRGMDETGKPGLFAAILLVPGPAPELGALTTFRAVLTQRLKQIDTKTPAWPIVVQGAPEVIEGADTIPGGRDYFEQVKLELRTRQERLVAASRSTPVPAPAQEPRTASRAAKKPRKVKLAKKARAVTARRTVKRVAARTARAARARRTRR